MKTCTTCSVTKALVDFPKQKRNKDGRDGSCKTCNTARAKAYYWANRDKCQAYHKAKRAEDPTAADARTKAWMAANPERRAAWRKQNAERLSASFRDWRLANPDKMAAKKAARRARQARATLAGDYKEALAAIYQRSALLSEVTGVKHHVDHIVPLKGRDVCGLHVPWNLQCIPALENISKKNRY